jgi:ATP-dependent DNA helicase RecG
MNPTATLPPSSIRYLKGVGPKRALAFEKLGITSTRDLLYFFPRRYEDRSQFRTISALQPGETVSLKGEILKVVLKRIRRMTILEMMVGDDSGTVHAVWFNQPYLKNQFEAGQQIILFGRIDLYQNRFQISAPEYEILEGEEPVVHTGRITPVYPLTEGLFQRSLRATLREILETQVDKTIHEYLPQSFRDEKGLLELPEAIREMHFPTSFDKQEEARRRLVFDEFLLFELTLLQKMEKMKTKYRAQSLQNGDALRQEFEKKLPFPLTASQSQALKDLVSDLEKTYPMNRLLQGDVGSGKTVVAAFALLLAAKNKHQGALLVPTEILAEQHYRTLSELLKPFGVSLGLLTSATHADKRARLVAEIKQSKVQIAIGTHALLQEDIQFKSLAVVIIDEQHKFGVHQRGQLLNRDPRPHQLVMTATPIPRTLALTVYGDMEVSVMKELPAGRKPIKTFWITRAKQREILNHIQQKIKEGDQAYFIFPLIEETEKMDLLAATKEYEKLRTGLFSTIKMGLVHGKISSEERDSIMRAFARGEIKILVATSVIEVGVNNPNATMMVIENAERFGLSQLHQMRGRIGRGEKPSECFLFGEPKTTEGQKRLRILTKTQDGFLIAEEDLKLRGPGDFWGTRQSGEPLFRIANPILDQELLIEARKTAKNLIRQGTVETKGEWASVKNYLEQFQIRY